MNAQDFFINHKTAKFSRLKSDCAALVMKWHKKRTGENFSLPFPVENFKIRDFFKFAKNHASKRDAIEKILQENGYIEDPFGEFSSGEIITARNEFAFAKTIVALVLNRDFCATINHKGEKILLKISHLTVKEIKLWAWK